MTSPSLRAAHVWLSSLVVDLHKMPEADPCGAVPALNDEFCVYPDGHTGGHSWEMFQGEGQ